MRDREIDENRQTRHDTKDVVIYYRTCTNGVPRYFSCYLLCYYEYFL